MIKTILSETFACKRHSNTIMATIVADIDKSILMFIQTGELSCLVSEVSVVLRFSAGCECH